MDVSHNTLEGCLREIEFRFSADDLKPNLEKAIQEFRPTIAIKGFRKGKVPLRMIEKMFGEEIEHDALQKMAEEQFKKIVEEQSLQPLGQPALSEVNHVHGGDATLRVRYEVKPEIELADVNGLKIAGATHNVTDEEVNTEIERQRYLESDSAAADEITSEDFVVNVDVQKLDPDTRTPLVGAIQRGTKLYLKRPSLQQEVRDAMHNKRAGDTFIVETKEEGEGGSQILQFTVNAIERIDLPPLTDEFVARISDSKAETVAAYQTLVREEMQKQWVERNARTLRDRLAEAYVAKHEFPVPETLVLELLKNFAEEYVRQGVPKDFDPQQFYEQMRPSAEWQARWALIREALIAKHNLAVNDDDVEALVEADHKRLGIDLDRLRQFYKTSDQAKDKILVDKVFKLLQENAEIS